MFIVEEGVGIEYSDQTAAKDAQRRGTAVPVEIKYGNRFKGSFQSDA